ncbi:hypothetical protein EHW99_3476 [Erwinia amylovora]|uniref:Uncharacterized protein n=3 Tax=Erwinia amylovora TaxID=552 RepID=A0A831EV76_ERWAM|nr:hypothetical protein EaACW_3548 [Erwinia amylovora ACW56400]QJQ56175.1 hypothetical protein EHX00_3476 [Erwinia amylovora]CBA23828.1 hypothetical protein predicted by Glimmer/Critica [Erwinia amylovora CFBP1430]CBX82408.1 hypothetical protein predicted by Glimmer/Critica [Erwinia amylovora ATCC BAA-2158]CCO80387.1 hypothetical protein BN432_3619 [Erwinia amylovora Ea356]CCO84193.1 hypothetical protein BN433_3648 [Erwinia amylovora Ea266]CCO87952.1 hypothetical protein BN434_3594 [Erwinia a
MLRQWFTSMSGWAGEGEVDIPPLRETDFANCT